MLNRDECFGGAVQMEDRHSDLPSLLQQVRMMRLKLGCILDRLEAFEPGREAFEQLLNHTDYIAAEVDSLDETVQQFMGK